MSAMNPKVLYGPPEQAPLSSRNAYTTWPGGVDPTVPLYNTDNQKFGGARARKSRSRKANRKTNRKASRKNARKSRVNRKANRKNGRKNTRRRVHNGGYQTCSPIDTLGSLAPIPMTGSVCPEGYFQNKNTLAW